MKWLAHWTLTATFIFGSAGVAHACPNDDARVGPSARLTGCRAYELVSPSDKNGASLLANPVSNMSSTNAGNAVSMDGAHMFYVTMTPGVDSAQGGFGLNVATRDVRGWTHVDLAPRPFPNQPASFPLQLPSPVGITSDFSGLVVSTAYPYDPRDQNRWGDLYLVEGTGASWLSGPALDPTAVADARLVAISDDGSHVVFATSAPLVPEDTGIGLYDRHGGQVSFIPVDDSGEALDTFGAVRGISGDGSRIFFTTNPAGPNPGLWVRTDDESTSRISGDPSAVYTGVTHDGNTVFFATSEALTAADTDSTPDIYAKHLDTGALTLVTTDVASGIAVPATARVSDDGSVVYFFALGQLANGDGAPGEQNLFVYDHGATRLVAASVQSETNFGASVALPCSTWRVTPDGKHLLFATASGLVSSDTDDHVDVYWYSLDGAHLRLASGTSNGAFDADLGRKVNTCWSDPTFELANEGQVLSDTGRYVFFETQEGIDPHDVNGTWDVYEYDADADVISLITDGQSPEGSLYIGSSTSGSDVGFLTAGRLAPQDVDNSWDVYDARINGGFPAPPVPAPGCTEDACQGSPSGTPGTASAASSSQHGAGNVSSGARSARASFQIGRVSRTARRAFARTGRLRLTVRVSDAGRVTALAVETTRGNRRAVARASVVARGAALVHPTLRLSAWARRQLRRGHRLHLRLTVTYSKVSTDKTINIILAPAR